MGGGGNIKIISIYFIPFQHGKFEIVGRADIFQVAENFADSKTVADVPGDEFFE